MIVVPVSEQSPVSHLLDSVYFSLPETVPLQSYGRYWLLRRRSDETEFKDIGSRWAAANGYGTRDDRHLSEIGIVGGDELDAIPGPRLRAIRRLRAARTPA